MRKSPLLHAFCIWVECYVSVYCVLSYLDVFSGDVIYTRTF